MSTCSALLLACGGGDFQRSHTVCRKGYVPITKCTGDKAHLHLSRSIPAPSLKKVSCMNENMGKKHDSPLKPPPALLPCGTTSLSTVRSSAYLADGLTTETANPEKSHDLQPEFRVFDMPSSPPASLTPHL